MKASDFDRSFDNGETLVNALDLSGARRPDLECRRIVVKLPVWMVKALDREARRLGVTRQSVIKMWLAERLQQRT